MIKRRKLCPFRSLKLTYFAKSLSGNILERSRFTPGRFLEDWCTERMQRMWERAPVLSQIGFEFVSIFRTAEMAHGLVRQFISACSIWNRRMRHTRLGGGGDRRQESLKLKPVYGWHEDPKVSSSKVCEACDG